MQPRRPPPPRPDTAPAYYDDDERQIGSPHLPDLPLKNHTPGLRLPEEINYEDDAGEGAGVEGGSRFQRMMNQARNNNERQASGQGPRVSPRSGGDSGDGRPPVQVLSREEKMREMRKAVDRQQKMMSKARGIDLDDPSLDGPALARKRAISRAQAEA